MDDGLHRKYNVERVDGRDKPGGDKAGARYFVLDYVNDPLARSALLWYADLCGKDRPDLAADLRRQLSETNPLPATMVASWEPRAPTAAVGSSSPVGGEQTETATQTCGGCGTHGPQTIGVPCGVCGVHP